MQFGKHTPNATKPGGFGGNQWKFAFDNGYGASVIDCGYGRESGLFEVAVLKDDRLTYDTPVTSDVIGYLTEDNVAAVLDQIEALTEQAVVAGLIEREKAERAERIADLRAELARLEAGDL